jgi:histidinol dehydrogenase
MLAQAEHDVDASAILLTTSKSLAQAVAAEIETQLATLATAPTARKAIDKNSAIILVASDEEAVELSNRFAPEHLSLHDAKLLAGVRHAGSVFLGPTSPEAAGDYASGPNHVLPTSGAATAARRAERGRLREGDFRSATEPSGAGQLVAGHYNFGPGRGPGSARALRGGTSWMMQV